MHRRFLLFRTEWFYIGFLSVAESLTVVWREGKCELSGYRSYGQ